MKSKIEIKKCEENDFQQQIFYVLFESIHRATIRSIYHRTNDNEGQTTKIWRDNGNNIEILVYRWIAIR